MKGIAELNCTETKSGDKTLVYKAHCMCGDDRHIMTLTLEYLKDRRTTDADNDHEYSCDELSLTADFKFNIDDYYNVDWYTSYFRRNYKRIKNRIKIAFWVLFYGGLPYELSSEFLLSDVDQVDGLIKALEKGKERLLS
jgi:hypothetical protein